MTNLEIALLITGQGMLGIFAVMGLITVLVTLFTKFGKSKTNINRRPLQRSDRLFSYIGVKSLAEFRARRLEMILIVNRRDRCVAIYTSQSASVEVARQGGQLLRAAGCNPLSKTRELLSRF